MSLVKPFRETKMASGPWDLSSPARRASYVACAKLPRLLGFIKNGPDNMPLVFRGFIKKGFNKKAPDNGFIKKGPLVFHGQHAEIQ